MEFIQFLLIFLEIEDEKFDFNKQKLLFTTEEIFWIIDIIFFSKVLFILLYFNITWIFKISFWQSGGDGCFSLWLILRGISPFETNSEAVARKWSSR